MDTDEEWAVKIRRMKFENHNQEWLELVDQDYGGGGQERHGEQLGGSGEHPRLPTSSGGDSMDGDPQGLHSPGFNQLVLDSPQDYWGDEHGDGGGFDDYGADVDYNEY